MIWAFRKGVDIILSEWKLELAFFFFFFFLSFLLKLSTGTLSLCLPAIVLPVYLFLDLVTAGIESGWYCAIEGLVSEGEGKNTTCA